MCFLIVECASSARATLSGDRWEGIRSMLLDDKAGQNTQARDETAALGYPLWGGGEGMETEKHCAYNQTRECFLGLDVNVIDIYFDELGWLLAGLVFKSGEGLWLSPFRGIPTVSVRMPLDVVYLDEDCRVVEVVESFPTCQAVPSTLSVASALILPAHSIYLSQTQTNDQMLICKAEEMECNLERFSRPGSVSSAVQSGILLRDKPVWKIESGVIESTAQDERHDQDPEQLPKIKMRESLMDILMSIRNWWGRWWSPDPRRAEREVIPGLTAYYWNGAAPEGHSVRNISATGLYLITEERWFPGTLITMTLQYAGCENGQRECAVSVACKAKWWGDSGVGLEFVLRNDGKMSPEQASALPTTDRKGLNQFLQCVRGCKL
jgi:hypothetical protein